MKFSFFILCLILCRTPVLGQTVLENQSFTGASGASFGSWDLSGDALFANRTQSDASVGMVTVLTRALNSQAGTLVYDEVFSSSLGIIVEFDFFMGGGSGADGIAFFLVDGATAIVTPGQAGGTLGYGTNYTTQDGVPNGFLGIGIDKYGNARNEWGNSAGTGRINLGLDGDNYALAGSGDGISGYRYLGENQAVGIGFAGTWARARVQVARGDGSNGCADGGICISLNVSSDNFATVDVAVFTNRRIDNETGQVDIPATFKLGFSASTGGLTNNHYIDNIVISTLISGFPIILTTSGAGSGTVTSSSSPSQSTQLNCGSLCNVAYATSSTVTLTANPATGSYLSQWTGDCSGNSTSISLNVNQTYECEAVFALGHAVTVSVAEGDSTLSPTSFSIGGTMTQEVSYSLASDEKIVSVTGCPASIGAGSITVGPITDDCQLSVTFGPADAQAKISAGGIGATRIEILIILFSLLILIPWIERKIL
jgi:hypothetical protein